MTDTNTKTGSAGRLTALSVLCLSLFVGCAAAPRPAPPAARPPAVRPEAIAGNWLFEVKAGSRTFEGSLHFSVVRGVLAGTWTSAEGREWELSKLALDADTISWESDGPAGRMRASGKIDGSSMKGTMKRVARARGEGSSGSSGSDSPDGDSGETPRGEGSRGGGRGGYGRGGRGGGRGGRGGGGGSTSVTWSAFQSVVPAENPAPAATASPAAPTPIPTRAPSPAL
jgi:hypothetical protein